MKTPLLGLVCVAALAAQTTVIDVNNTMQQVFAASTLAATIAASSGDGSICTFTKYSGSNVNLRIQCTSGDGKTTLSGTTLRSSSTAATWTVPSGGGDVYCLFLVNPTAAAVTMGTVGPAPAAGVAWACTTNVRTAGVITGNGPIVNGSVSWP